VLNFYVVLFHQRNIINLALLGRKVPELQADLYGAEPAPGGVLGGFVSKSANSIIG
jgi:hypothetical protein